MFNYTNFIKNVSYQYACQSTWQASFQVNEFFNKSDTGIFDVNIFTKFANHTGEHGPAMYIKYEFHFIIC